MKTTAIIQARMDSTRLPQKVMMELAGKPVLRHVLERASSAKNVEQTILATTINSTDDALADAAKAWGYNVFRGSEDNVLERYVQAANKFGADPVIRITADCPATDPQIIDEVIERFVDGEFDVYGLAGEFPDGLDVTVYAISALERALKECTLDSEREHIGLYLDKHPEIFKMGGYHKFEGLRDLRWTLDEEADYKFLTEVFDALYSEDKHFNSDDILALLEQNPELSKINSEIIRNEGLQISLEKEK